MISNVFFAYSNPIISFHYYVFTLYPEHFLVPLIRCTSLEYCLLWFSLTSLMSSLNRRMPSLLQPLNFLLHALSVYILVQPCLSPPPSTCRTGCPIPIAWMPNRRRTCLRLGIHAIPIGQLVRHVEGGPSSSSAAQSPPRQGARQKNWTVCCRYFLAIGVTWRFLPG